MDPLSVTASIIAVIQISGGVVSICYNYRNAVKGAAVVWYQSAITTGML